MVSETTIEITVIRMKVRLAKVTHPSGYQLVCGGRLLLECRDGVKTPHPELPEYTTDMFPVKFDKWSDGDDTSVTVSVVGDSGHEHPVGIVRACTLLLSARPVDAVKAWLASKRSQ